MNIFDEIEKQAVVPVFVGWNVEKALRDLTALAEGGFRFVEIAIRTPVSVALIKEASSIPNLVVGAGTVNNLQILDQAISAGAKFAVTPGLVKSVLTECINSSVPIIPGISTPSEILAALENGASRLKLFPSESLGGLNYINSLAGPFPDIMLMPSGGINENNYNSYLQNKNVFSVSGSWMLPKGDSEMIDIEKLNKLHFEILNVNS